MHYRNTVEETAAIIKSKALKTIETKLAAASLVINYTTRNAADHATETLERKRTLLGINRVETVYVPANNSYNVIPYFESIEEMDCMVLLLASKDILMT